MSEEFSLGIDLGTSAVKVLLLSASGTVLGQAEQRLTIERPHLDWSEQHPAQWWQAVCQALAVLRATSPVAWPRIAAIGLTGQMHGAVLLDRSNQPLRPAILHNDGRAAAQCQQIEAAVPDVRTLAGSRPMPGLTAPKLLWLAQHEPQVFAAIDCVLSPKDYVRLRLTGERATDASDAAGTLWLDVKQRQWSPALVQACGIKLSQLPPVRESHELGQPLLAQVASELGLPPGAVVACGGGDTPVSGLGIGAVDPGDGFINLSTSGALVVVTDRPALDAGASIHALCHALPARWYQMGAMLSGASCLRWASRLVGARDEASLLQAVESSMVAHPALRRQAPIFLPYLAGERTPHNDVNARGVFMGMTHDTNAAQLGHAVLEGVCFGLLDGLHAIESTGTRVGSLALVGGGARSTYWADMLAHVLGKPVQRLVDGDLGAAVGAARLGWLALGRSAHNACPHTRVLSQHEPDDALVAIHAVRHQQFRALYPALAPIFAQHALALQAVA